MKILIVDDSPEQLKLLVAIFERLGHECYACASLDEASRMKNIDLALVDWKLDDGSGVDLLEILSVNNPHTQKYLMSATKPDASTQVRLDKISARYEAKPISPQRLAALAKV